MPSILKAARSAPVVHRIEIEAKERARLLLASAQADASRVRADAEAAREAIRSAAVEAGRAEAFAAAGAALAAVAAAKEQRLAAIERELAEVALTVARALVGRALALEPSLVLSLAREALAPARTRLEVVLRVHPSDAPLVRAELPALAALLERAPGLGLKEDPALARGDVVVETEAGRVDARVVAQLQLLEQAVARAEGQP